MRKLLSKIKIFLETGKYKTKKMGFKKFLEEESEMVNGKKNEIN